MPGRDFTCSANSFRTASRSRFWNEGCESMIIVTGHVIASPESREEMLRISLEHVHRSRLEPGCIEHGVYFDAENPLKLHFYERWADLAAIKTHFPVPE